MKLIKQPNGWTCGASCVCMLTGTTLEEFYAFCGHDGSGSVPITKRWPIGRRCFSLKELLGYLLTHDMFIGWGLTPEAGFNPQKICFERIDFEHMPALVTVESITPGTLHQVLWNTERIIDPLHPDRKVEIEEYKIVEWWPITKMPPIAENYKKGKI